MVRAYRGGDGSSILTSLAFSKRSAPASRSVTICICIICGKCDLCSITTLKVAHCEGNELLELQADASKLALNIEQNVVLQPQSITDPNRSR